MKKYYEAYEKRYTQMHALGLEWEYSNHSPILDEVIEKFHISGSDKILELGCGEGRDACHLLDLGYDVLASDISPEAVRHCQSKRPDHRDRFIWLNACEDELDGKFDFIYSIAVLHMLVVDEDRDRFLSFVRDHLSDAGLGLILTMGDGEFERATDIANAFDDVTKTHDVTGREVQVAQTSCRIVSFKTLDEELRRNGLTPVETGITAIDPGFPVIMYAIVRR